jgi:hypothetical protein
MAEYHHQVRPSLLVAALADPAGYAGSLGFRGRFGAHEVVLGNLGERAGLDMRKRDAQRRPGTLVAISLKDAAGWIDPLRRIWEQRFASLDWMADHRHVTRNGGRMALQSLKSRATRCDRARGLT